MKVSKTISAHLYQSFSSVMLVGAMSLSIASTVHAEQICEATFAENTPESRYTISTDGSEVTDTKTNLIWKRCTLGQTWNGTSCEGTPTELASWKDALKNVKDLGNGYRLPNVKEYLSMIERKCYNPAVNSKIFAGLPEAKFGGLAMFYWTSTPTIAEGNSVHIVDLLRGVVQNRQPGSITKSGAFGGYLKPYAMAVRTAPQSKKAQK